MEWVSNANFPPGRKSNLLGREKNATWLPPGDAPALPHKGPHCWKVAFNLGKSPSALGSRAAQTQSCQQQLEQDLMGLMFMKQE